MKAGRLVVKVEDVVEADGYFFVRDVERVGDETAA